MSPGMNCASGGLSGVLANTADIGAEKMEHFAAKKKCSFRAKRRLITCSEIVKINPDHNEDGCKIGDDSSIVVEESVSREFVHETAKPCAVAPSIERRLERKKEKTGSTSLSIEQTLTPLQDRSAPSSGYISHSSSESSKTFRVPKPPEKKKNNADLLSLRTQVIALRNSFGVLKLLLSQLGTELKNQASPFPTTTTDSAHMSSIRYGGFSPDLIEYGIRLAYLDILSPRQSVLVDKNWLRGIELVIVHLFRYGVVSEKSIQYSTGVARCFKVLALIATEIPEVTDLIFKLLELSIRKKVSSAGGLHRQYIACQTSLLCRNCPRLALKLLKLLTSEFSAMLISLHQNPENYVSRRPVTFFLSNLILDIMLQLPKGCGSALKSIADDLRNIPTNAHLLSLAKQDILDHVDFKLRPYAR